MDTSIFLVIVSSSYRSAVKTCLITHYEAFRLGGDILAGVTVASMLIPQSVSYASSLAKLSPVTGLVCFGSYFLLYYVSDTVPSFLRLSLALSMRY